MTLSTYVGFVGEVDPMELHAWVLEHLLEAPDAKFDVKETAIWNAPGQGFDAWVITHHNNGAPVVWWEPQTEMSPFWENYGGKTAWLEEQARERRHYAKHPQGVTAYVNFDTAYGYQGENGADCNMLHALWILRLQDEFAKPRGLTVVWQNEYTGEWHTAPDGLQVFIGDGEKAQRWFTEVAKPAIEKMFNE